MNESLEQAAQYLVKARQSGKPGASMPEGIRPTDFEGALAVQSRVGELLGLTAGGWKCSLPSPGKMILAPIWKPHIHSGPRCPALSGSIEPEIAFVIARDLPRREQPYSEAEVAAAIGETHLVLELIASRFAEPKDAGFLEKMADSLSNQGLYVGPVVAGGPSPGMSSFPISIESRGATIFEVEGKHGDGHPLVPLVWLANRQGLKAGDIVTTGSYAGVIDVPVNEPLRIVFGEFGAIETQLTC